MQNGKGEASLGVRSVGRSAAILSLLTERRPKISLREISDEIGLPRTTVIRLVATLTEQSLLWAVSPNTYVAGPRLLRWTKVANVTWAVPPELQAALETVTRSSRETGSVYVRSGASRVCIAQLEGTHALRHVTYVGRELPLWAGAPSKVLLASLDDKSLLRIAAASPKGAPYMETLQNWRTEAVRLGFAVSHGELEDGLSVVAVPVGTASNPVATLSLAGPKERFSTRTSSRLAGLLEESLRTIPQRALNALAHDETSDQDGFLGSSPVGSVRRRDQLAARESARRKGVAGD